MQKVGKKPRYINLNLKISLTSFVRNKMEDVIVQQDKVEDGVQFVFYVLNNMVDCFPQFTNVITHR